MPYKDPIKAKENAAIRAKRWRERHPERAKEVARNSARKIRGYIGPVEPKIAETNRPEPIRALSVERMTMLRKKPSFKKKLYASWQGKRKPSKPETALLAALKRPAFEDCEHNTMSIGTIWI